MDFKEQGLYEKMNSEYAEAKKQSRFQIGKYGNLKINLTVHLNKSF